MLDPSRLLRLISSKTATGICVAALASGAGTVGVMAAVGGSGPAPEATTSSTTTTTTSSHATSSRSESDETETSETGDKDGHGDAVRQGVIDCKAAAAKAGAHGIGHCVSKIAQDRNQGAGHND